MSGTLPAVADDQRPEPAPLVAGLLVEHVSGSWAVGAFAATMAVAAVLCLALPGLREAEAQAK